MEKRIVFVLALGAVACLAMPVHGQSVADPGAEPGFATGEATAQTPADEMANRVRSIRRNEYFYQSYGRPDLFAALVTGEFQPMAATDLVDVNNAKLVGVMWGATDRFALVEDGSGNGFILRVGDRVNNGRVVSIQEDNLVAAISLYGLTSRVILRLEDRKDKR